MSIQAVQRYVHIYWVPTIPLDKKMFAVCDACQATIDLAEQPDVVRMEFAPAIRQLRTPPWTFSGLAVLGVAFFGLYLSSQGARSAQAEPAAMTQTLEQGGHDQHADQAPAVAPVKSRKREQAH
jgi:hypothetical protein